MKNSLISMMVALSSLWCLPVFAQTKDEPVSLGLPGDNLDLYAVLDIFQKSKTIEDFEKTLNDDKEGINNLDLNNDKKVDFIKVITNKDGDSFSFVLQVAVSKTENQDVAVIFVSKDAEIQIIGDEDLYGKNYVIEPKKTGSSTTANPGYSGGETMNLPAKTAVNTTNTFVVQEPPIVRYVYSPAYMPYYSPFYFGFYPRYFHPWVPLMYRLYWSHNYHYHRGYYGGYRGSVNINIYHANRYNTYNRNARNRSNTVNIYNREGRYKNNGNKSTGNINNNRPSTRPTSPVTRPTSPTTRPTNPTTRPTPPRPISPSARPTPPTPRPVRPSTRPTSPTARPNTRPAMPSGPTTRPMNPPERPTTRPAFPSSPSTRPAFPSSPSTRPASHSTRRPSSSFNSTNRARVSPTGADRR